MAKLPMGELENMVMDILWDHGGWMTPGEVTDVLAKRRPLSYSTILTILVRLVEKGRLTRRKDGRAFLYSPAMSRAEFEHGIREDVIDSLLEEGSGGIEPLLACFVDSVSERDRDLLDELDRLVREKKKELKRKRD